MIKQTPDFNAPSHFILTAATIRLDYSVPDMLTNDEAVSKSHHLSIKSLQSHQLHNFQPAYYIKISLAISSDHLSPNLILSYSLMLVS